MPLERLGPYKLERLLGRGGMGSVYAGVQVESGERAAVKVLSAALADDVGFRERFKSEIETLKKLRHPNIVQLFGYGEEAGHLFYAMELVEGRNLHEELASGRRFEWHEVCHIGVEICQALKHAHDVGVIHRDLKPANLMISRSGQIKLSDFGIAKLYGASYMTADGGVLGTADFMAPEQADGSPVTARSDLYSVGSVLFALLARRPPFVGKSMAEVLHALKYDEAPHLRQFAPFAPEELDTILAQLLDKEPKNRIATALALSNRLKAMLFALGGDAGPLAGDPPVTRIAARTTQPMPGEIMEVDQAVPVVTRALTQAPPAADAPATENAVEEADAGGHFTKVEPNLTTQTDHVRGEDEGVPKWLVFGVAVGLVAVMAALAWYFTRPPTADGLYARIIAAAEDGNPQRLSEASGQIDQFLLHYADDPRGDEVQGFRREIELYRRQRQLELRARSLRASDRLLPVEEAYLVAMQLERTSPEQAAADLKALIDLFGGDKNMPEAADRCLDLAKRQLALLEQRMERRQKQHLEAISERLKHANAMVADNPQAARLICEGIVTLYGDKAWASEMVEEARSLLTRLPRAKE
jgi:serine/threonine-protein kinase